MPRRPIACMLLFTVSLLLSGCTAPRPRAWPGADMDAAAEMPSVAVGDEVDILLQDGRELSGEVTVVTTTELTVSKAGNFGREETIVPFDAIASITVPEATAWGKTVIVGMSVAVVSTLALLLAFDQIDLGGLD